MILDKGDMWSIFDLTDFFIVTTNSYIRQDGALVMGRGIAAQMKARFPTIPYDFAAQIDHLGTYGLILHHLDEGTVGAFQVKHRFNDAATLSLIQYSVRHLKLFAESYPTRRIDMNFPGIGNGRLTYDSVLPLLKPLPDNVHIWTFGGPS